MPAVRWQLSIPANGTATPDLRPYDRFGGGGGAAKVRCTVPVGTASNSIQESIFIGSELIEAAGAVGVERATGAGPDNFTPSIGGVGGPGDPINVSYRNLTGAAIVVSGIMDVENA